MPDGACKQNSNPLDTTTTFATLGAKVDHYLNLGFSVVSTNYSR